MMKKLRFSFVTILSVGLLLLVCACEHKPAKLELAVDTLDLETVIIENDPVEFDVEVRNAGDDELIITGVETTCDCTTVDYSNDPIKGGDKTVLHVTFSAKDFFPSDVVRELKIFNNTADNPVSFYFKARLRSSHVADTCSSRISLSHS